ncbi:MAG: DUF512 domain-containing protein [Clostridia bacterium]|nr:DUF512 domain-containing protein [Clostridia bacterium]
MSALIKAVEKRSAADKAGIKAGEKLISINGKPIRDVLDYDFYSYDSKLLIELESSAGVRKVRVTKSEGSDLGLEFETYLMDAQKGCSNKCVFCFIDQLPRGMRKTLYFKDDDARLSFLLGNYITLTNLSDEDADRIIKMRISPLNVSVHTTDSELRTLMLGNKNGGPSLRHLYAFCKAGLKVKAQIVVCPGLNDGAQLRKTLADLSALYPSIESIAIVPVGLTKHRDGLYPLKPVDQTAAEDIIDIVDEARRANLKAKRPAMCCAADELYLKAGRELPDVDYYEGFAQLENGVGLMTSFADELELCLRMEDEFAPPAPWYICCGLSAEGFMNKMVEKLRTKCPKLDCKVVGIPNEFFGGMVDVSGLVTGGDLIARMQKEEKRERILIPDVMLRHGETVFLDDVSIQDAENKLGMKIDVLKVDGGEFLDAFITGVQNG